MDFGKKGVIEFGWIFSIIVGAVVLFLAFYFIGTHMAREGMVKETLEAQNLDAALNPFGYLSIMNATKNPLELSAKSEVEIRCDSSGAIGYDSIKTIGTGKNAGAGIVRNVYDKYIYADISGIQLKSMEGMAVSLKAPWRIADLIMLWPFGKKYCFTESVPEEIRDEMNRTGIQNIFIEYGNESCPEESATIGISCSRGYDISICQKENYIEKNGVKLFYYGNSLMYAAVFSEQELYNCNLNRLGKRLALQGSLYEAKANNTGCASGNEAFENIISAAGNLAAADSNQKIAVALDSIESASAKIEKINEDCGLY